MHTGHGKSCLARLLPWLRSNLGTVCCTCTYPFMPHPMQKPLVHGLPAAKARCFHLVYNLSVHGELLYPSVAEAAEAAVLEAGELPSLF